MNEAFASVALMFLDEFGVDHGKVNVNGGAIAMGHPLGATGAMIGHGAGRTGALGQRNGACHLVCCRRHGCGHHHRARLMPKIDIASVPVDKGSDYPSPLDQGFEDRVRRRLGDAAGLTTMGVNLTTLPPAGDPRCVTGTRWRTRWFSCWKVD